MANRAGGYIILCFWQRFFEGKNTCTLISTEFFACYNVSRTLGIAITCIIANQGSVIISKHDLPVLKPQQTAHGTSPIIMVMQRAYLTFEEFAERSDAKQRLEGHRADLSVFQLCMGGHD